MTAKLALAIGICVVSIFMLGYCSGNIIAIRDTTKELDRLETLVDELLKHFRERGKMSDGEYRLWRDLVIGEEENDGEN